MVTPDSVSDEQRRPLFSDFVRVLVIGFVVAYITGFLCSETPRSAPAPAICRLTGLSGLGPRFFVYAALPALMFGVLLRLKPQLRDRSRWLANRCAGLALVQNAVAFGLVTLLSHR